MDIRHIHHEESIDYNTAGGFITSNNTPKQMMKTKSTKINMDKKSQSKNRPTTKTLNTIANNTNAYARETLATKWDELRYMRPRNVDLVRNISLEQEQQQAIAQGTANNELHKAIEDYLAFLKNAKPTVSEPRPQKPKKEPQREPKKEPQKELKKGTQKKELRKKTQEPKKGSQREPHGENATTAAIKNKKAKRTISPTKSNKTSKPWRT
ncbi:hypothetical protein BGZ65_011760 [Modicella reniformis]|uniref:Uncharacterized protein n=1 Tax=Modicella reniformis TaxID=1440133 RepID=A0A9P6SNL8_9FUNG|nr:hypothetical protein BGZ65_011760 [Modicella reniformis]